MYSQQYDGYRSSSEIQLIPNVGYILGTNNKQDTKKSKLLFIAYLFSELLINEMKSFHKTEHLQDVGSVVEQCFSVVQSTLLYELYIHMYKIIDT